MWKCRDVLLHSDQFKLMFVCFLPNYYIIICIICMSKKTKQRVTLCITACLSEFFLMVSKSRHGEGPGE